MSEFTGRKAAARMSASYKKSLVLAANLFRLCLSLACLCREFGYLVGLSFQRKRVDLLFAVVIVELVNR